MGHVRKHSKITHHKVVVSYSCLEINENLFGSKSYSQVLSASQETAVYSAKCKIPWFPT